jgi:DNA-binding winged helix-turn-helix (wHTH) protein/Flp pilus assembly protein TadD
MANRSSRPQRYTRQVYEFGPFRLDPAERVLSCDGKPVHLTLKAFAVLLVLIARAGHVVEKDELMRQVWPDAFVEEANLTQSIALARRALRESHDRRQYIETIHRRGYRFIAIVNVAQRIGEAKSLTDEDAGVPDGAEASQGSALGRANAAKQPFTTLNSPDAFISETVENRHTENEEAYHLYVRGRCYWSKYSIEGLMKGIDHFRGAIKIDPTYALAHAGLADCYYRLSNIHMHPKEAMPKAKLAAMSALGIDDTLAEAHALLGLITLFYDRDWPAAETEFKRSIELAPDCALVHNRYGWALGMLARFDEAVAEMKQALHLAPLSSQFHVGLGIVLHLAGSDDLAIAQAQQALDMNPDFYAAHTLLGMAYAQQHRLLQALPELEEAASLANLPWTLGYLGYVYGVSGEWRQAFELLFEMAQRSKQAYVSPYGLALIYAGLGNNKQTLLWLERTYEDRNEMFGFVKCSPEFGGLRLDPRFAALLNRSKCFATDRLNSPLPN